jgi:hypothetical protein
MSAAGRQDERTAFVPFVDNEVLTAVGAALLVLPPF